MIAVPAASAMMRSNASVREVYLHPGDIHVTSRPACVTTILGSCVSVCLYERYGSLGGINHYLLPKAPSTSAPSTRYGDFALAMLLERLIDLGAVRSRLQAKIFGGANVLHAFAEGSRHIGTANVELAHAFLAEHRIDITAEDVAGTRGRKLVFAPHDGTAWVKEIGS